MADAPIERLLKDIIKNQAPHVFEIESPAPKKVNTPVKKKPRKKLAVKKPCTPEPATPSGSSKNIPQSLSACAKKALRSLGWKEDDDSPKGGAKGKKKIKQTEVEKLKEDVWETWNKPLKRGLDYETDEEDD